MRTTIAYYFLLIYMAAMLKPVFPLVSDALSHTFSEAVHLSTVHMVYGTHHLQNEIATSHTEDKKNNSSSEKSNEVLAFHVLQSSIQLVLSFTIVSFIFSLFLVNKLPLWYRFQNVPPPNSLS